jgi:hypothetical protein
VVVSAATEPTTEKTLQLRLILLVAKAMGNGWRFGQGLLWERIMSFGDSLNQGIVMNSGKKNSLHDKFSETRPLNFPGDMTPASSSSCSKHIPCNRHDYFHPT